MRGSTGKLWVCSPISEAEASNAEALENVQERCSSSGWDFWEAEGTRDTPQESTTTGLTTSPLILYEYNDTTWRQQCPNQIGYGYDGPSVVWGPPIGEMSNEQALWSQVATR